MGALTKTRLKPCGPGRRKEPPTSDARTANAYRGVVGHLGDNQPVRALMAAAAVADPGVLAFTGPQGPVELGGLAKRVESTAAVLVASGVVAMLRSRPPSPPLCGAGCTAGRHRGLRRGGRRADPCVGGGSPGSSDWATLPGIFVGGASVRRSHGYHRPGRRDSFLCRAGCALRMRWPRPRRGGRGARAARRRRRRPQCRPPSSPCWPS